VRGGAGARYVTELVLTQVPLRRTHGLAASGDVLGQDARAEVFLLRRTLPWRRNRGSVLLIEPVAMRRLLAAVAFTALVLAGCKTTGSTETTDSIYPASRSEADWRRDSEAL